VGERGPLGFEARQDFLKRRFIFWVNGDADVGRVGDEFERFFNVVDGDGEKLGSGV